MEKIKCRLKSNLDCLHNIISSKPGRLTGLTCGCSPGTNYLIGIYEVNILFVTFSINDFIISVFVGCEE